MALHCGWKKVNVFSDSKIGIDCIGDLQGHTLWKVHAPLLKIKEKKENLIRASFVIIRSSTNIVQAHQLAKSTLQSIRDFIHIFNDENIYPYHE